MEAVAEALLNHRRLTVVTNHLTVATILNCKREFQVILAGGVLKHNDQATTGEATREFLEKFRVGYGIFGIGGVSEDGDHGGEQHRGLRMGIRGDRQRTSPNSRP